MSDWQCCRSGDCCRAVEEVVMTHHEREAVARVLSHAFHATLQWASHEDPRFVRLRTPGGCPLLATDTNGRATCTVHAVRPFNCRRWGCFRDDVHTEPLVMDLAIMLNTRDKKRQAIRLQRKAQRWALAHGWPTS